jgi:hypothetical protein
MLESYNGIYRVLSILTFDKLVNSNIDLYNVTYKPVNISEEDYLDIISDIQDKDILELQKVDEDIVVYIPEYHIIKTPDINVKAYYKLGLAVNLGIFDDKDKLDWIKNEIEQTILHLTGINKSADFFTIKEVWMNEQEYQDIEDDRNSNITNRNTLYSDKLALQKQVTELQTLVNEYENLIISLQ